MSADPLTPAVSDRICKHMNDDHAEAVLAYARHYGGVEAPVSARMLAVRPEVMELEVDGSCVEVRFDHTLTTVRTPTGPWCPCCGDAQAESSAQARGSAG